MGKIKRLLDRFDEMGRYPIQELGYSRTWLMFRNSRMPSTGAATMNTRASCG